MELKLPDIFARYVAKQVIEAIKNSPECIYITDEDGVNYSVDEVLNILFPEDSNNG